MPDRSETTFVFMGIEYRIPLHFPVPGNARPGGAPGRACGTRRGVRRGRACGPPDTAPATGLRNDPLGGERDTEAMDGFSVNDIVGIDGDEYRVLRILPDGLFARHERFASHSQVLSFEDIRIARNLGLLSVRQEPVGAERPVDDVPLLLPVENKVESRGKRTPSRRRTGR